MTVATGSGRSLHLHSLTSLLADLVSGRAVGLGEDNGSFALGSPEARALLDWYRLNQAVWSKNVARKQLTQLIDATSGTPPALPEAAPAAATVRTFAPVRVAIHNFSGIQEYNSGAESMTTALIPSPSRWER